MSEQSFGKEHFRKGFVLILTVAYCIAFMALIYGFIEALLLAAVFSGIVYPMYQWFLRKTNNRISLSSVMTLAISLLLIVVPLLFLLGLVAEQAIEVSESAKPWIEKNINSSTMSNNEIPEWVPFNEKLEPYSEDISQKVAELAGETGVLLASNLGKVSEGAARFFLNLFVMLYAMSVMLVHGPAMTNKLFSYFPLSSSDQEKMVQVGLSVSRATVKGTLIIGIIQGTLGGIGFAVAGVGSAVFWGAIMAVLSVLPGIGATLVWGPAVIYLLMTGDMVAGVGLLIWSAGVVGTVDNFLRPILVGRDSEMPDLLILLSTLGGLGLFGASGLVLGPILAAMFMTVLTIYSKVFQEWLQHNEQ